MTRHHVLIPAWRRPEFLWACLHRLRLADRPGVSYAILLDRMHSVPTATVAQEFRRQLGHSRVTITRRGSHPWRGNSYNVLQGYGEALRVRGVDLVHLVEEDIFVGHDYFDYHEQAHALAPVFAVSACRNQNEGGIYPASVPSAVYRHASYQSLGVSFRPDMIRHAVNHAGVDYYRDPGRYCREVFPDSAIPPGHCEQDGLINRVREATGGSTIYPYTPRAYHAGFYGYNRRGGWGQDRGSAAQLGRRLLGMGADELNSRARHYKDHSTIDLDAPRQAVDNLLY